MDDIGKDLFKEEKRGVVKSFKKLPKWLRMFLFVSLLIFDFIGGLSARPLFDRLNINLFNSYVKQNGNSNIQIGKVAGTNTTVNIGDDDNCPVKFCSKFTDGKWQYIDRFSVIQEDPLILKSPSSKSLPGATMYFSEEVGNFTMQAFITPMASQSANISVAYGHFLRCIIGDGDYSKIACQINVDYPKSIEKWSYLNSEGKLYGRNQHYQISHFPEKNELQIRFKFMKINDSTQIEIKINDQIPMTWNLPREFENRTKREKVGIGLFTAGQDDVSAVFKLFQLDPNI